MPTEDERAELSKKRGRAAAYISDPKRRAKYGQKQGKLESEGKLTDEDARIMRKSADETIASEGKNVDSGVLGSYKKGGKVKKTGPYKLHKGEEVIPAHKVGKKKGHRGKAKGQKKAHKKVARKRG